MAHRNQVGGQKRWTPHRTSEDTMKISWRFSSTLRKQKRKKKSCHCSLL